MRKQYLFAGALCILVAIGNASVAWITPRHRGPMVALVALLLVAALYFIWLEPGNHQRSEGACPLPNPKSCRVTRKRRHRN